MTKAYQEGTMKITTRVMDPIFRGPFIAAVRQRGGEVKAGSAPVGLVEDSLTDWLEALGVQ